MPVCVHVCVNVCENQNDLRYGSSRIVCFDNETVSHTDLGTTNWAVFADQQAPESCCLSELQLQLYMPHVLIFHMGSGLELRFSGLSGKHLLMQLSLQPVPLQTLAS